jgi:hypothetical protein
MIYYNSFSRGCQMKVTILYQGAWDNKENVRFPIDINILDYCPECGCKRGRPFKTIAYEFGIKYEVDIWINPCGHIDYPRYVYYEAKKLIKDTKELKCSA